MYVYLCCIQKFNNYLLHEGFGAKPYKSIVMAAYDWLRALSLTERCETSSFNKLLNS